MTVLLYIAGVVLCAVGIAASIALHELGHLIPGKLYDVKITQYFIGFGRTLWSRRRGETEYGVKAVPLGGYVRLVGMVPPPPDSEPGQVPLRNTGMLAQLASDARAQEYEHVEPGDHHRLFYNQAWWKRVIIMGCGVAINLVLSFALFAIVFMGYGVFAPTTTVHEVSQCVKVVRADQPAGKCTAADPVSPARKAGIRPGDRLLAFNGTRIEDYDQLSRLIRANESGRASIVVERDGHRLDLHARTTINLLPENGDPEQSVRAGFLGITPTLERQRQGLGYVASTMADGTWQSLKVIATFPQKVYHAGRAALGLEKRSINSPMSVVGVSRAAGEMASDQHTSLASRFFRVVLLIAGVNLFLGLINLVPLPPFDGGGIATTLYEALRRGFARIRGRPDPGVVDAAKLLPLTYVMVLVIVVVSVVLVYADIVAPVQLT